MGCTFLVHGELSSATALLKAEVRHVDRHGQEMPLGQTLTKLSDVCENGKLVEVEAELKHTTTGKLVMALLYQSMAMADSSSSDEEEDDKENAKKEEDDKEMNEKENEN